MREAPQGFLLYLYTSLLPAVNQTGAEGERDTSSSLVCNQHKQQTQAELEAAAVKNKANQSKH